MPPDSLRMMSAPRTMKSLGFFAALASAGFAPAGCSGLPASGIEDDRVEAGSGPSEPGPAGSVTSDDGGEATPAASSTSGATTDSSSVTNGSSTSGGTTGDAVVECDFWAQDCPEGEKCVHHGEEFELLKCVPIVPDAGQLNEPCTMVESMKSGQDTCDMGYRCWPDNFDLNALEGTCRGVCLGSSIEDARCEDPYAFCAQGASATLALCQPQCDPLLQNCAEGEGCYWTSIFACYPDESGDRGYHGDSCDWGCDPGTKCVYAQYVPGCQSDRCCTSFCDLTADSSQTCSEGQGCEPHYWDDAYIPPALANVGVCLVP